MSLSMREQLEFIVQLRRTAVSWSFRDPRGDETADDYANALGDYIDKQRIKQMFDVERMRR